MTIQEAHQEFKTRLDKIDALEYPIFQPEEIDLILNNAQDRYVKQRYSKSNFKRLGFEEEQKRTEDLKTLIKTIYTTPVAATISNITDNSCVVDLESDHWFIIWEEAIIYCSDCNDSLTINGELLSGIEVEVRPTTHNEAKKNRKDAFKGPDREKVLRVMAGNQVELIPSSDCTVIRYKMRYIKKPERVNIDTNTTFELSEHTHSEIIDEAVKITLENIEAKRNPTFTPIIDNQKE